jgi:hypothetical protein
MQHTVDGTIIPSEAIYLQKGLLTQAKIMEVEELKQRIENLEIFLL